MLSAGPAVGGSLSRLAHIPAKPAPDLIRVGRFADKDMRQNMSSLRVLILGGYGTFGGRLAQLLADEPRLTLIIAGRARDKAEAFCARLGASAQLEALAFDRDGDVERALAAAKPDIVVDASGPFQNYAGDPYRLVRACLALGIDYLDLADGSDFVDRHRAVRRRRAGARRRDAVGGQQLSGADRRGGAAARARHVAGIGAARQRDRRDRAVALCGRRAQRHPRHRELRRQAGAAGARRPPGVRPRADRDAALHHRAARRPAAAADPVFARRRARPAGAARTVARAQIGLDGRRPGAGNPAPRLDRARPRGAARAAALARRLRAADARRHQRAALGRASRRHVRRGRRRRRRRAGRSRDRGT